MPDTLLDVFTSRAAAHPERPALSVLRSGGAAADSAYTWGEWTAESRAVAASLLAGGLQPGERVAILAGNRAIWPIADVGVLMAGGISVGLYPTSAPVQIEHVLRDCGAAVLIVDTAEQLEKVRLVSDRLPELRTIVCEDPVELSADVAVWDVWLAAGSEMLRTDAGASSAVDRRIALATPERDALLIYTSGSTGEPKGARVSHRYLSASANSISSVLALTESDSMLSFLPYCHAAERVFGLYTRVLCGMECGLVEDHQTIWDAAADFRPSVFGGLPRFYEKAYEGLREMELAASGAEAERWRRVLDLGRQRSRRLRAGGEISARLENEWRQVGAPIFAHAADWFGGRARLLTSGGAALPGQVSEYLDALGQTVLGAYGLTEHLCVAFQRPGRAAIESAGPPMPGTELRFAADGEILIRRGSLTFSGYHGLPERTREAFTADGEWLLTGDLGELDERGMLRITGRKKELIALSTGKKVPPLPIEAALMEEDWISHAVVIGEGKKYLSALLSLRRSTVEAWSRERSLALPYEELLRRPEVLERVGAAVEAVNSRLSRSERVRRFTILERDLSVKSGELTPTLKVRRSAVAELHSERIEAMYPQTVA